MRKYSLSFSICLCLPPATDTDGPRKGGHAGAPKTGAVTPSPLEEGVSRPRCNEEEVAVVVVVEEVWAELEVSRFTREGRE